MRLEKLLPVTALALSALLMGACDDDSPTNADGMVTNASVSANPGTGNASTTFNFTGQISTTDAATVTYRWEHDNGDMTDIATLPFDDAGTKTITHTWDPEGCSILTSNDRWARLVVLTPNALTSSQAVVHIEPSVTCP
jgi:hypothetical protein